MKKLTPEQLAELEERVDINKWEGPQPWKEQHAAHAFLYDYLCKK